MSYNPEWDDDPYIRGTATEGTSGAFICVVLIIMLAFLGYFIKTKPEPMPKIDKVLHLEITPEQFVNACDETELQELQMELDRRLGREQIVSQNTFLPEYCISHPMICEGYCQKCSK
jgi:hypothetical protein